jgi:hypothetical protein
MSDEDPHGNSTRFLFRPHSEGSRKPSPTRTPRYALRIFRACHQIYNEALPVFYSKTHFLFHGHDFHALIRFLLCSGRERSLLLRHVSFATMPLNIDPPPDISVFTMDITPIIRLRSGTKERNAWNEPEQRRLMIRALWQFTRPKALLLPPGLSQEARCALSPWQQHDLTKIKEDAWSVNQIVEHGAVGWPEAPYWIALGYNYEPEPWELAK